MSGRVFRMLTAILVLMVASAPAFAGPAATPQAEVSRPSSRMPRDPSALTFNPSPDHDAVDDNGPRVLKYLIDFSPVEGLGTAKTVDIGKPAPQGGVISVPLAPLGLAPGRYLAQVRVLGPTSSAVSATVGPFQLGKPKAREPEAAPAPAPTAAPSAAPPPPPPADGAPPNPDTPKPSDTNQSGRKGGFWRRLYEKIVGT
jgi:hypothetical protein